MDNDAFNSAALAYREYQRALIKAKQAVRRRDFETISNGNVDETKRRSDNLWSELLPELQKRWEQAIRRSGFESEARIDFNFEKILSVANQWAKRSEGNFLHYLNRALENLILDHAKSSHNQLRGPSINVEEGFGKAVFEALSNDHRSGKRARGGSELRIASMPEPTVVASDEIDKSLCKPANDSNRLDLLLFISGVRRDDAIDEMDLTTSVRNFEASRFNAIERRHFANNETGRFRFANGNAIWMTIKRHYWRLLHTQGIWDRVVYPLRHARGEVPDVVSCWKQAFEPSDLGSVLAAMIMGGWVFFDSSREWFEALKRHGFANQSQANFLMISMMSLQLKGDTSRRTFAKLQAMYRGDQDLEHGFEAWKSRHPLVWRHFFASEIGFQEKWTIEDVLEKPDHFGFFEQQPMPLTGFGTRSFLLFADLPCDYSATSGLPTNNISMYKIREEVLRFQADSSGGLT